MYNENLQPYDKPKAKYININGKRVGIFSQVMLDLFAVALKLHFNRSIPVLIGGETGTGKEILARYIHYGEDNKNLPFVALNCASLTSHLFESELFGYEPGTFSGGLPGGKQGKLDLAQGGTLFLDEIGELPLDQQAKLLRVIQEKEYYRVGGLALVKTNARIICASNKNLKEMVARGTFRQDLYYRLNAGYLYIPPLRAQREAIIPMARLLMAEIAEKTGKPIKVLTPAAIRIMENYNWPGNIRELYNIIEWIMLMYDDKEITSYQLSSLNSNMEDSYPRENSHDTSLLLENWQLPADTMPLQEISNDIILRVLQKYNGNKTAASRYLGISRSTLYYRLQGIEKDKN